jgi:hypothetical protein
MKRFIIILMLAILGASTATAQDLIIMTNGDVIKAEVIEITGEFVKYNNPEDNDEKIISIKTSEVNEVIFENGEVKKILFPFTTLSIGFGFNYGIPGIKYEYYFPNGKPISFHLSLGTETEFKFMYHSLGMKYFLSRTSYIDFSGGGQTFEFDEDYKGVYFISIILGDNYFFSNRFGINYGVGSALVHDKEKLSLYPAFDFGLSYRF